jgi:hypothetical protein
MAIQLLLVEIPFSPMADRRDNWEYVYAIGHPHGYVKIGKSPTTREAVALSSNEFSV